MPEHIPQFEHIQAETIEAHSEQLDRSLTNLELHYFDKFLREARAKNASTDFIKVLEESTPIVKVLVRSQKNTQPGLSTDQAKEALLPFFETLENAYEKTADIEEMTSLIMDKKQELKQAVIAQGFELGENENQEKFGAVSIEKPHPIQEHELYGLQPTDEVLEMHITEAYLQGGEHPTKDSTYASFTEVARAIVARYPQVKAIVGRSWLMDTGIAKRIGFHTIPVTEHPQMHEGFWMQFMDSNGQINQERVSQFFETGQPKYQLKYGYIPVVEFLTRFLPDDERGQITLKKINSEYADFKDLAEQEILEFQNQWDQLAVDSIRNALTSKKNMAQFFDNIGALNEVISILEDEKRKGHSWAEISSNTRLREIGKTMKETELDRAYISEQVTIPPRKTK